MSDLRKNLIRLAHENPELRPALLPVLKQAGSPVFSLEVTLEVPFPDRVGDYKLVRNFPGEGDAWYAADKWEDDTYSVLDLNSGTDVGPFLIVDVDPQGEGGFTVSAELHNRLLGKRHDTAHLTAKGANERELLRALTKVFNFLDARILEAVEAEMAKVAEEDGWVPGSNY